MKKNFLQLSDLHIDMHNDKNTQALSMIIDYVRNHSCRFEFAIVTGDLVNQAVTSTYLTVSKLFRKWDFPVYFLPGNHDDYILMKTYLDEGNLSCPDMIEKDYLRILFLDSTVKGEIFGNITDKIHKQVEQFFERRDEKKLNIISIHHPPMTTGVDWIDEMKLKKPDKLLNLLNMYAGETWVFAGHIHQARHVSCGGIQIMTCPATSREFVSDGSSQRFNENLHCFRIMTICATTLKLDSIVVKLEL